MKTLYLTNTYTGTSWLLTDAKFAEEFKAYPAAIESCKALQPGKTTYFDVNGETAMAPPITVRLFRVANTPPVIPLDVVGPVLALAVFLAGVVAAR